MVCIIAPFIAETMGESRTEEDADDGERNELVVVALLQMMLAETPPNHTGASQHAEAEEQGVAVDAVPQRV